MSNDLAILVPVLERPNRAGPLLDNIREATPGARVLFVADTYDFPEQKAIREAGGEMLLLDRGYAGKINAGVRVTTEPLIFTAADDLHFHEGWFEHALEAMTVGGVHVVGVNDMLRRRRPRHATHFLMTREYAQQPCADGSTGPMAEAYDHSFVDDELIATAAHRGAYFYADSAVVEHRHHWMRGGTGTDDETYRKGRVRFREDRALYRERSHLWT